MTNLAPGPAGPPPAELPIGHHRSRSSTGGYSGPPEGVSGWYTSGQWFRSPRLHHRSGALSSFGGPRFPRPLAADWRTSVREIVVGEVNRERRARLPHVLLIRDTGWSDLKSGRMELATQKPVLMQEDAELLLRPPHLCRFLRVQSNVPDHGSYV